MTTYVWRDVDGKMELVDKATASPLHETMDATHVIRDVMDPTLHMANGRTYDSKHAFRAATRAAGCIEVGDQKNYGLGRKAPKLDKRARVEHIKHAIHQLRNGG